jgi:NAD(P)-dependent dehydrogenase (short-subunit alcohol dehydrogenase family)
VLGCGRSVEAVIQLCQQFPAPHDFAVVDVANDGQVGTWVKRLLKDGDAPDLVVNNAAVINRPAPLWDVPPEEFDRVIDINVKGVANVLRYVVPAMVRRKSGVIVNLSSGWGRSVDAEVGPYCATKWAIEGLTKALAEELPDDMAAIPLNPGIIDTEMLRASFGDEAGQYPNADTWSRKAAPFVLQLGPRHNGQSLTVPT